QHAPLLKMPLRVCRLGTALSPTRQCRFGGIISRKEKNNNVRRCSILVLPARQAYRLTATGDYTGRAPPSKRMTLIGAPLATSGPLGGRMISPPASARGSIIEESWRGQG